jgi:hypothetical protein
MPFGNFTTLGLAIKNLHVTEVREDFVQLQQVPVSDTFRAWLDQSLCCAKCIALMSRKC